MKNQSETQLTLNKGHLNLHTDNLHSYVHEWRLFLRLGCGVKALHLPQEQKLRVRILPVYI
jgi:hypothetical protein